MYKLKNIGSKFSFLLVPLTMPFLWLMFCRRRGVTMYDHAVFSLYSLRLFAVLLLIFSFSALPASAQPAIPDTPAGKVFGAMLTSFNSGDPQQFAEFDKTYRTRTTPLANVVRFYRSSGGFTLVRLEKNEPHALTALLKERDSDTVARIELTVTQDAAPKILVESLRAQPLPPELAPARLSEAGLLAGVKELAARQAMQERFSGAVLIARNGKILLNEGWGYAERDTKKSVTQDTRFRIGSMNKMFTAVAILQLVEAGKLGLDDTIGMHLPDYPNKDVAGKVKIHHLLSHTGGTGNIFGPEFNQNRLTLRAHADYLKLYSSRGLVHEPGEKFDYSNYGFVLLGAIVEKASGMSYYDYVDARIYAPAGMTGSGSLPEETRVENLSAGYMWDKDAWVSNAGTLPFRGMAAGGGYSTVGDLFRFAQALQSGVLLSKPMVEKATSAQSFNAGYGFFPNGKGKSRSYGHGGGAPGMNGELRMYPETGYTVIVLSNFGPPAASRLSEYFDRRMPLD